MRSLLWLTSLTLFALAAAPLLAQEAPATLEVRVRWAFHPERSRPEPLPNAIVWADAEPLSPLPLRATLVVRPDAVVPQVSVVPPGGRITVANRSHDAVPLRLSRGRKALLTRELRTGEETTLGDLPASDVPIEVSAGGDTASSAYVRVLDRAMARTSRTGAATLRLPAGEHVVSLYHPWVGELSWPSVALAPGEVAVLDLVGSGEQWDASVRRREQVGRPPAGTGVIMGRVLCSGARCAAASPGADGGVPGAAVSVGDGPLVPVAVTDADGRFRLEGVPAGDVEVQIWHPTLGQHLENARIAAGAVTVASYAYHDDTP